MTQPYTKTNQGQAISPRVASKITRAGQRLPSMWPEPALRMLIEMRSAGRTGGQISKALREAGYNYTRSAVCGRIHRLKREGFDFARPAYEPTKPTLCTSTVLGTFLERLCDVGQW